MPIGDQNRVGTGRRHDAKVLDEPEKSGGGMPRVEKEVYVSRRGYCRRQAGVGRSVQEYINKER